MNLKIENLTVKYTGKTILNRLNLELDRQELVSIIGPNGTGKTTLLKAIATQIKPTNGAIYIDGKDLNKLAKKELARIRAFVSAEEAIKNNFISVYQYLSLGRTPHQKWHGFLKDEDQQIIREVIEQTGINLLTEKNFFELSSGEKQRVQIARALIQKPKIILLDEPTSHLDINYQLEIMKLLKKITQNGIKVITVLHDLNLASQFCDRIILLNNSEIIAFAEPVKAISAENLQKTFGNQWEVINNPITGNPKIFPLISTKIKKEIKNKIKLHIIGGGGSISELLKELSNERFDISVGVVNTSDSDYQIAKKMNLNVISEEPFSAIGNEARLKLREKLLETDYIILTSVPFGVGNLANLEELLKANQKGKKIISETTNFNSRDFTGGMATLIWEKLKPEFSNISSFISFIEKNGNKNNE